jgi:hypothetical protein
VAVAVAVEKIALQTQSNQRVQIHGAQEEVVMELIFQLPEAPSLTLVVEAEALARITLLTPTMIHVKMLLHQWVPAVPVVVAQVDSVWITLPMAQQIPVVAVAVAGLHT